MLDATGLVGGSWGSRLVGVRVYCVRCTVRVARARLDFKMTPEELIASNPDWLTGRDDAGYDHAVATQVLKAIVDGDAAAATSCRCRPAQSMRATSSTRTPPLPNDSNRVGLHWATDKGPCADHPLEKCSSSSTWYWTVRGRPSGI